MAHYLRIALVPVYLMLSLILGGASLEGYWVNMVLQLLALPIIAWSLLGSRRNDASTASRQLLAIVTLVCILLALQRIPLPPEIWTQLPGREQIARGFQLLELPLPWLPLSLTPLASIASGLWLLPALAVLLGIVKLGAFRSPWLAWSILIITGIAVGIGTLQILGSGEAQWQFYVVANYGQATGFFANSNHMATLLVACIPFLVALYLSATKKGHSAQRASGLLVILAGTLAVLVVGLAINGSLAGIGLAVPAIAASLLMVAFRRKSPPWWSAILPALLAVVAVYLVFEGPFGNDLTGAAAGVQGSRFQAFTVTLQAAKDFFPFGSGVGSFVSVFRSYEDPAVVERMYMNHAHNDYYEILLETGLPGLLVLALFLFWWGRRAVAIWGGGEVDHFARAATVTSAVILAHSIVDYPLRTAAVSALFAACCGLMADPRSSVRKPRTQQKKRAKHLSAD